MLKLIVLALAAAAVSGASEFRAGVAKTNLEPPPGAPMAGYGTARFAKGVLDPIEARVLALSDGARKIALVTLDLCYTFGPPIMEKIRARVHDSVDEVVFVASHTHSGPTYAEAPEAAEHAAVRIVEAIESAAKSMEPARIGNAWGQTYLGFNRRYLRPDGSLLMFWRNESKVSTTFPFDPTVGVIRVDRNDGRPLAMLVHYACHPVVLGPDNLDYSADYPGEMRRVVEQEIGQGVMAFFLQGAPGDINPYFDKTPLIEDAVSVMKETGRKLALEAVRVSRTITTKAPAHPQIQTKTVIVPAANRWDTVKLRSVLKEKYRLDPLHAARLLAEHMELPVTTLVLNQELAFVGMPGEPFVEFQMQLRAKSPMPNSFLIGYTNGYFAYFPTIGAAIRGGYGADSTVVPTEAGTGERMLNTGLVSIYELLGKLHSRPGSSRGGS